MTGINILNVKEWIIATVTGTLTTHEILLRDSKKGHQERQKKRSSNYILLPLSKIQREKHQPRHKTMKKNYVSRKQKRSGKKGWGTVQWHSICLPHTRLSVGSPAPPHQTDSNPPQKKS